MKLIRMACISLAAALFLAGCPKDEPKQQESYDPTNGTDTPEYKEDTTFKMPPAGVPDTYIGRP